MGKKPPAENPAATASKRSDLSGLAGLYVHIPFCVHKCPYCDFYSVADTSYLKPFVNALALEMGLYGRLPLKFDTLYIGGGTPSLLESKQLAGIIESTFECFNITKTAEITLEVNPGTVCDTELNDYRHLSINRLNIGVQSFLDHNLKVLGRIHTAREAAEAISAARRTGFDNIGLDMIYGLPGQTVDAWNADLEKALVFEPEHLSCYLLTYEPGTAFERRRSAGLLQPLGEGLCGDLFEATAEFLDGRGYQQYEVSNFARGPELRSRHNQKYWSMTPYIGLGPSAHSFVEPVRFWNDRDLQKYIAKASAGRLPIEKSEVLSSEQQVIEMIYLGLRTVEGIDLDGFEIKFEFDLLKECRQVIARLKKEGLASPDAGHLKLTLKGMLFLDSVVASLIDCCPSASAPPPPGS